MLSTIKKNPKSSVASIIMIISMIAGVLAIDDRYCKAKEKEIFVSDLKSDIAQVQKNLIQFKITTEITRLSNSIFELNLKKQAGTADAVDEAMLERYRSQLEKIKLLHNLE